ncbi:hypothetical protein [Methylomonas koyamae]|uniref:Uncharacterized protein n=1 Tax=Methylomonas koyamae TaxID=702114 RepID=A0A177NPH2_9GAMM|nr:hypothetical protein [Methylomonas koyamae]ATG89448.1 hypothetical protein MKLM6_1191 [Methylomonas koyamae]OAI19875.1 hypothetical protein A1507_05865 [Methylomonas koyamae]OAI22762.1 hypothetical protein A1356_18675 [Methylomonas koyamae]WNB74863.1 hypothetical protein RI210_16465 [Methylomonas koyamae]
MKKPIFTALLTLIGPHAAAMPPDIRSLPLERIGIERIDIQSQIRTWTLNKVCIDGQAYLLLMKGLTEPVSITAAFANGKPEQCRVAADDTLPGK